MLTDLVIDNFQSIKHAHFKLGKLTVITGPTGSGKSGVLRGFELVAFNKRGVAFIRQGTASCTAGFGSQDEGWFIAIDRGGRGKDAYRIARGVEQHIHDDDGTVEGCPGCFADPELQTFTKLEGKAPPEVLAVHRLGKLNFTGQFESPFLLESSGSEVARILGELTNVSLVYEAARGGARRRGRISADLKRAEAEAVSLAEQVQQYAQLPAQIAAQERAEHALVLARTAAHQVLRLRLLGGVATEAAAEVQQARDKAVAAEPPSLETVETLLSQCDRLFSLIVDVEMAREEAARQHHFAETARAGEQKAHQAVHEALEEMGTCPTCGQVIR